MIESIYLDNYKHFKSIKIDGLKRLNIFSGQNNTGKTSILEALLMFYDRGTPDSIFKQLSIRGIHTIDMNPSSLWQPMFNNFDLSKSITIKVYGNGVEEKAVYSHNEKYNAMLSSSQNFTKHIQNLSSQNIPSQSLHSAFTLKKRDNGESDLFINGGKLSLSVKNLQKAHKRVIFVPSSTRNTGQADAERLGKIDINSGLQFVTNHLRLIEPRLKSLSIVPQGQQSLIYGDIGLSKKIPISYMGEGITKLLSILVTIASSKDLIVCIDEIENGIHYSLFPKIWEIINSMAKTYNCQLFITTHSYDALKGLYDFQANSDESDFTFTRLDWVDDEVVPKTYDSSMLLAAMDRDWEIR